MSAKDWYNAGAQIGDLIEKAISSNNFDNLSKTIEDTLSGAFDMTGGRTEYRAPQNAWQQAMNRANVQDLTKKVSVKSAKGIAEMVLGWIGVAGFGIAAFVLGLISSVLGIGALSVISLVMLALAIISAFVAVRGGKKRKLVKRADRYMKIMGGRDTVTVEELAAATGSSTQNVVSDIDEMFKEGLFPATVYFDDQKTTLIGSREAFMQYQQTRAAYMERQKAERESREARREAERNLESIPEETRKILSEGREFIAHIHESNEAIPDPEFTAKLNRLENVVTRIFDQVEKDPESAPDLHKMMSYYLPITRKLVDAYRDLNVQGLTGSNAANTRREIEASLDTVNGAFETLLDSFFEDTAWDISSDISTLKTMMARDGLTGTAPGSHIKTVGKDLQQGAKQTSAGAFAGGGAGAFAAAEDKEEN